MRTRFLTTVTAALAAALWMAAPGAARAAESDPAGAKPATASKPAQTAATSTKANPSSPIGFWKTIDDATGKAKSIVEIWEENGKVYGKIVKLLSPPTPDPVCAKCEGELKDAKIVGLTILKDLKKDGDEYSGGRVLDPDNGKTYKCTLAVVEGGQKLKLRGYLGISLLERTQYWQREQQ